MNAIQNFAFEENLVRVIERDGEPWFVGKDICEALGLAGPVPNHLRNLDDDERGMFIVHTPGGDQEVNIVSEPGVYRLVFRSRKPEAERFKRWLAHEVLPQIRKTGEYRTEGSAAPAVEEPLIASQRLALAMVTEARMIYGAARARALWEKSPALPSVPQSALLSAAIERDVPPQSLECLWHLLDHADVDGRTVAEMIRAGTSGEAAALAGLEQIGIKLVPGGLWVAAAKPQMQAVFAATSWKDGRWVSLLRRIPGITGGHERMSIGGFQARPIWIPASALGS